MSNEAKSGCLIIACGALAKEFMAVRAANGWSDRQVAVPCLPAIWHNRPEKIPGGVRAKIRWGKKRFSKIFVLYGDCGTGGLLDEVLKGRADLAMGSRYVEGGGIENWNPLRRLVSRGGSLYAQGVLTLPVQDLTGGFKWFRAEALRAIDLGTVRSRGYASS